MTAIESRDAAPHRARHGFELGEAGEGALDLRSKASASGVGWSPRLLRSKRTRPVSASMSARRRLIVGCETPRSCGPPRHGAYAHQCAESLELAQGQRHVVVSPAGARARRSLRKQELGMARPAPDPEAVGALAMEDRVNAKAQGPRHLIRRPSAAVSHVYCDTLCEYGHRVERPPTAPSHARSLRSATMADASSSTSPSLAASGGALDDSR